MFGDVTSANVVGYAGNQLDDDWGNVLVGAQFNNVGGEKQIRLGDIKPIAQDSEYELGNGDVDIQTLTSGGNRDKYYKWDGSKWIDSNKQDASDVLIPAGKGLWVGNSVDPDDSLVTLQSSGEVGQSDILVQLDDDWGNVAIGNGFPVAIKLGQISLEAENEDYEIGNGDVDIQTLTSGGNRDKYYKWDGSKWVDSNKQNANDVEIPAGKGLWVANSVDPDDSLINFRIPAPVIK